MLAQRPQTQIAAGNRRENRQAQLKPEESDSQDDWDRLIDEISENENVDVTRAEESWLVAGYRLRRDVSTQYQITQWRKRLNRHGWIGLGRAIPSTKEWIEFHNRWRG
ncbi:DUF1654 domain-containing protein [Halomonas eurihalina]|uniref:DUF1654 domain-containing protein n=1 Tax=Halomonas eurihalina TaxID=42566 RepID=A0A5D9D9N6_HALER|nr:DUF1654 domain-containing protein [Halomonas eurihalina]